MNHPLPDPSAYRNYEQGTHAVYPVFPSASDSSLNIWFQVYELIAECNYTPELENSDYVQYVFSDLHHSDRKQYDEKIKEWLIDELQLQDTQIKLNKEVPCFKTVPASGTSDRKRPDLAIYNDNDEEDLLLQFEVNSKGLMETLRKLELGLMNQLRWLRNHNDAITVCTGFYFPPEGKEGHVIQVNMRWCDSTFKFNTTWTRLPKVDVSREIQDCLERAKAITDLLGQPRYNSKLTLPISKEYLRDRFGQGAFQVASGQSVVIVNISTKSVYKHPLSNVEYKNLTTFLGIRYSGAAFPLCLFGLPGEVPFFQFQLYTPPLTVRKAREKIAVIATSISTALEAFHDQLKFAHLDVRIYNICYKDETYEEAVLIDLGRSAKITTPALQINMKYPSSVMFKVQQRSWTAKNLDWRQFGLMLCSILDQNEEGYHKKEPRVEHGSFLAKLLHDGKLVKTEMGEILGRSGFEGGGFLGYQ